MLNDKLLRDYFHVNFQGGLGADILIVVLAVQQKYISLLFFQCSVKVNNNNNLHIKINGLCIDQVSNVNSHFNGKKG